MQIQVNTASTIDGREGLITHFQDVIENGLSRFSNQITTVEVHLSDENGPKNGPADKRCLLEARLEHRKPTAVTHEAETLDDAVAGALDKMTRSLGSTIERSRKRR